MLSDAIDEIHRELEAAADRRNQELRRRADVRRADDFLLSIEDIIENRRGAVPSVVVPDDAKPLGQRGDLRIPHRQCRAERPGQDDGGGVPRALVDEVHGNGGSHVSGSISNAVACDGRTTEKCFRSSAAK